MNLRRPSLLVTLALLVPLAALAADWPQWRGPGRDGLSKETGLLHQWPEGGPKLAWKAADVGDGYSTPSVARGRVYLMGNRGMNDEFVLCLDEKTGNKVWSVRVGKVGRNYGPNYPGARSTPTVDGDVLYALGSDGDLVCLETAGGKEVWHKNLRSDFGGRPGAWAYSESPLVDGDKVVCTPGGKEATLVALNKKDGSVIWKSAVPGGDAAAYASIVLAEVGGARQYVQFLGKGLVGVDARTGKFLWRFDETAKKSPANIPTPVVYDNYVFSSTGLGGGAVIKLVPGAGGVNVETVWTSRQVANPLGGVVLVNGHLYGTNSQSLICVEVLTGKVKWQDRSVGKGEICYADGALYVRGEKGDVALVEATPEGYKEKGRFAQPDRSKQMAWPYPVVANGRLYLRDWGVLLCYDIGRQGGSRR
jgi:outer membrane protein assembly factor BamB